MSWNIQSRDTTEGNKLEDPDFINRLKDSDIICFQETRKPPKLCNYKAFSSTRPGQSSGGVSILYKTGISGGVTHYKSNISVDFVTIKLNKNFFHTKNDIYIVCFYIPPSNSSYRKRQEKNPWELLNDHTMALSTKGSVILCGDTNARTSTKPDFITTSGNDVLNIPIDIISDPPRPRNNIDTKHNSDGNDLIDLAIANNLYILNGRTLGDIFGKKTCFNYKGSSTIDYILASRNLESNVKTLTVEDCNVYSDHRPLLLTLDLRHFYSFSHTTYCFENFPRRYKWDSECTESFKNALNDTACKDKFDFILQDQFPQNGEGSLACTNLFTEALISASEQSLNKTNTRKFKNKKKWYTAECALAKRELNRSARKMSNNLDEPNIRKDYYEAKRKYRNLLDQNKRQFRMRLNQSIENGHIINWQNFKYLKQDYADPIPFDNHDLASFYDYFAELYSPDELPNSNNCSHPSNNNIGVSLNTHNISQQDNVLNSEITICETITAIKGLKSNKSVGVDLISNEMLQNLTPSALETLVYTFNHCLSNGSYPWNESVITPIYKSGDLFNPDNYRAIAVSSCLGKLFSSILLERLIIFRKENCSDPINQLGFCKHAQTNDHILTLKTIIDKYKKKLKNKLFACFVDLKKAFDTINRQLLLHKLMDLNIKGNFFHTLKTMYDKSVARIKINNLMSPTFKVSKGTEQGHPMSPELFKLFIRDLTSYLNTSGDFPLLDETAISHLLWADDLVLLSLTEQDLQRLIDLLTKYCNRWGLSVNLKKTKIISFGKKSRGLHFYLNSEEIEMVDSYCYLGITIHKNGNFKSAIDNMRKKALRGLFGLKKVVMRDSLSIAALLKLFDALIKPILLYGCQVLIPHTTSLVNLLNVDDHTITSKYFSFIQNDTLENFHLKFLKWCLGVHRKTSNIAVWGETGRYPLLFNACKLSVDYYIRVRNADESTLLGKSFIEQKKLNLDWHVNMSNLIDTYYNDNYTIRIPSTNVLRSMEKQFSARWSDALHSSNKLDFYRQLKHNFINEYYLKITNFSHRSALTRLRTSSHNLKIERGRYDTPKTPREDRTCDFCEIKLSIRTIENENHLLSDCQLYTTPRNKFQNKTNKHPADVISESRDLYEIAELARFISNSMDMHSSFKTYLEMSATEKISLSNNCILL